MLGNIEDLLNAFGRLVDLALPIIVAVGLLAFFYGLAKFIFSAGDGEKQKEGRQIMIYGVIALFVMVSVWGLVNFIGDALDIDQGESSGTIPSVTGL
ncbi:MAG: pilin [bacterium]|nr:pilin [bacterium]